jgi:hypothetical protein
VYALTGVRPAVPFDPTLRRLVKGWERLSPGQIEQLWRLMDTFLGEGEES